MAELRAIKEVSLSHCSTNLNHFAKATEAKESLFRVPPWSDFTDPTRNKNVTGHKDLPTKIQFSDELSNLPPKTACV